MNAEKEKVENRKAYAVETVGLTKLYGDKAAVKDLNLKVGEGQIYGFIGRNGAGKSTTLKMLSGLAAPTSGEVRLFGKPVSESAVRRRLGVLIEAAGLYPNMTARQNGVLKAKCMGLADEKRVDEALELTGLADTGKKQVKHFSMGMKQRLGVALALLGNPDLLILDEPINGLDPIGIAEVRSFIRNLCDDRGKTILISSHILSEIALLADDIGIIDHGILLEEESFAKLEQKSSRYIQFTVSDTALAATVLERRFHETQFTIQDDRNLQLHDLNLPVAEVVAAFVKNGLAVSEAHTCEESLEDYFKRVTGGEGIA